MRINVVYNSHIEQYSNALETLESALITNKVEFQSFEIDNLRKFGDFTFVIGGDGTLLKAARFYIGTPLLGINSGRLGFLSQAGVNEINKAVDAVISGEFSTEERLMLISENMLALNDFVIKGCKTSRTSKFCLEINDRFVCDYIADGLIVSTPTGSTAYGLSAGGPILYPTLDAMVIVPICPHTLNARPLVVPVNETIVIKTLDELLSVAADGFETNKYVKTISVKAATQKAKLAFLRDNSFYSVLRNKLHWGVSPSSC